MNRLSKDWLAIMAKSIFIFFSIFFSIIFQKRHILTTRWLDTDATITRMDKQQ